MISLLYFTAGARQSSLVHSEYASASSTNMLRVSTAAPPCGPGRGSAKALDELQEGVSCTQRRARGQSARSASPDVAPNHGHPAALLACAGGCGGCARRPWWAHWTGGFSVASEGDEQMYSATFDRWCVSCPASSTVGTPAPIQQPCSVSPQPLPLSRSRSRSLARIDRRSLCGGGLGRLWRVSSQALWWRRYLTLMPFAH